MSNAFVTHVNVRFRDIDAMGHVNNAVFFTYFEEGRKAFFQSVGQSGTSFFPFILANISCDYLKPVGISTQLSLRMLVEDIGNKSFVFRYTLVDQADESIEYARGRSVQVCFDYEQNRSVEVPADLRQVLTRYRGNQ